MKAVLKYMAQNDFAGVLYTKKGAVVCLEEKVPTFLREIYHFQTKLDSAGATLAKFHDHEPEPLDKVTSQELNEIGSTIAGLLEFATDEDVLLIMVFEVDGQPETAIFKPDEEERLTQEMREVLEAFESKCGLSHIAAKRYKEEMDEKIEELAVALKTQNIGAVYMDALRCEILNPEFISGEVLFTTYFQQNIDRYSEADLELMSDAAWDRAEKTVNLNPPVLKTSLDKGPFEWLRHASNAVGSTMLALSGTHGNSQYEIHVMSAFDLPRIDRFLELVKGATKDGQSN